MVQGKIEASWQTGEVTEGELRLDLGGGLRSHRRSRCEGDPGAATGRPGGWSEHAQRGCGGIVVREDEGGGSYTGGMGPGFT